MIPWKQLDSTDIPNHGGKLRLLQRDREFSIRIDNCELMNSRAHGSEEKLAEWGCSALPNLAAPRVLIGGLGMGFTAAASLLQLGEHAQVEVAELLPAVVRWNRDYLGHLAGHPLQDPRLKIRELDVAALIKSSFGQFDAILLDVDNGPEGLTQKENDWLYSEAGLKTSYQALKAGGVLAVWSAAPSAAFSARLAATGFQVREEQTRARTQKKGGRHTIWLATRG
jgi:spermidine synthase